MLREQDLLTAALRLPQIPWVFNFFFNTEPHVHLSMFTASVRPSPAFTLRTQVRAYATTPDSAHFNSESLLNMLHLPVFTKDDITVGYAVTHCIRSTNIALASTSPTYHPFARDNKHVIYFAVRQYPHAGYVEVDVVDFSCAIVREKLTIRFQYETFQASLDFKAERILVDVARRALIFLLDTKDDRDCVVCRAASCVCTSKKIMLRSPRGPSDVSNEAFNFLQGLGSSRGKATIKIFRKGAVTFSAPLIHDLMLEAHSSTPLKNSLVKYAVSKLMDCTYMHPAATCLMDSSSTATIESCVRSGSGSSSNIQHLGTRERIGCSIDTIAVSGTRVSENGHEGSGRRSRNLSLCRLYNPFFHVGEERYRNHWCINCVAGENLPLEYTGERVGSEGETRIESVEGGEEVKCELIVEKKEDEGVRERQRKSWARREKNREAARKSNAKKAAYLRNLRLELGEASRKKTELMSRLDCLREENRRLKLVHPEKSLFGPR